MGMGVSGKSSLPSDMEVEQLMGVLTADMQTLRVGVTGNIGDAMRMKLPP